MTLQNDLSKAEWQKCRYWVKATKRCDFDVCPNCENSGYEQQIFENESTICEDCKHEGCDECEYEGFHWKYKSGDVIEIICPKCNGSVLSPKHECNLTAKLKFKILRTLDNDSKIEVVRL